MRLVRMERRLVLVARPRGYPFGWHVPEALRWAWRSITSRDASKIRRGGRASGLKRATPRHVYYGSNRGLAPTRLMGSCSDSPDGSRRLAPFRYYIIERKR
jgi:hypothetical protein